MRNRLAISLILALLLPMPLQQASANTIADIEERLSVSFSLSVVGTGSSRSISQTVQVTDSQGALTLTAAAGNQLRILDFRLLACVSSPAKIQITLTNTHSGCQWVVANFTQSHSVTTHIQTRRTSGTIFDSTSANHPILTPMLTVQDSNGVRFSFFSDSTPPQSQALTAPPPASRTEYLGPLILEIRNKRAVLAGESVSFRGRKLSEIFSATIGSFSATVSHSPNGEMTVGTDESLTPGVYSLVVQSRYGTLTHLNAVQIKPPTQLRRLVLRGPGQYLNESQVKSIVSLHQSLNSDYKKLRCIVNSANAQTAKAVATRVCALLAKGEARDIEVIHDVRNTFKGKGFWVRVFAAG